MVTTTYHIIKQKAKYTRKLSVSISIICSVSYNIYLQCSQNGVLMTIQNVVDARKSTFPLK